MSIDYKAHPEKHPFYKGSIRGNPFYALSAADRIYMVEKFTLRQCADAILLPEVLQKTVLIAIKRRAKSLTGGTQ